MATENLLSSTGVAGGIEVFRPAGRAYQTLNHRVTDPSDFLEAMDNVSKIADENGRRRWVLRARTTPDVVQNLLQTGVRPSVNLPLSEINAGADSLITVDHNTHESAVPEWDAVYTDWRKERTHPDPADQVENMPKGFSLTRTFGIQDRETLFELWKPFGWTREKISNFIDTYQENDNLWVSGVRDEKGQLASACMGEALIFDGIYMVEATEFGTRVDLRRKNLSALALIGLNAQIIQRARYEEGHMPLIISEYNMDPKSRSDNVGRKTGMTIPGVEAVQNLTEPTQVLSRNVAVLDGGHPNDLAFHSLPDDEKEKYRNAYRDPFRYWRNFIVGMMTEKNMDRYYSPEQVAQILSEFSEN